MDQNRRQFLAETEDLIEQVFADLDKLREEPDQSRVQRELLDRIFRSVHRVKGSAASFGFGGLGKIAHEFEHLLGAIRAGQAQLDDAVLDACEGAATALSESLHLAYSGAVEPSRRALFKHIRTLAQGTDLAFKGDRDTILSKVPSDIWQSLSVEEKQRLAQAIEEGTHLCLVTTSFDLTNFDDRFNDLRLRLSQHGDVVASSPTVDVERADKINFRILFLSKSDLENVNADLGEFPGAVVTAIAQPAVARLAGSNEQDSRVAGLVAAPPLSKFIRLDADELDQAISSTHELFRTTARALDLACSHVNLRTGEELKQLEEQIRGSFLSVEKELIGLRMVSVGPILQRAARAGRAAARLSNKEIVFEVVGENLRLDKVLCEAIADPLIHLVRNAVDHGIEPADQSVQSTAKQRGLVRIEAENEAGQTCVRVIDNGRGVDPELVGRAAIQLGIIDKDTVWGMDRSLRLIFRPGFTTLPSASTVSGRGVGLDIVETAVEQVGGELRVSSEPGRGSTFEIRLPATFGLLPMTVVGLGSHYYCIESSKVIKTEAIEARQIEESEAGEVVRSDGEGLPLVRMHTLLGQSDENSSLERLSIVTCDLSGPTTVGSADREPRIGIVVDEVHGSEEMLVRSLGSHAGRWRGIAGATELRDGTVALVVDLPRLMQSG